MISLLNRKELIRTNDEKKILHMKDILEDKHIKYSLKIRLIKSGATLGLYTGQGTRGKIEDIKHDYIIYVKRKDYSQAYQSIYNCLSV